jgi:hypothetical protein
VLSAWDHRECAEWEKQQVVGATYPKFAFWCRLGLPTDRAARRTQFATGRRLMNETCEVKEVTHHGEGS